MTIGISIVEWNLWYILELPRISTVVRPLQYLPVAKPPGKSIPFGGESAFDSVLIKLLLPGSDSESPKTKSAGGLCALAMLGISNKIHINGTTLAELHLKNSIFCKRGQTPRVLLRVNNQISGNLKWKTGIDI